MRDDVPAGARELLHHQHGVLTRAQALDAGLTDKAITVRLLTPVWCTVPGAGDPAWQAWGVILGIGVDVVDISRMDEALRRTPALASRLFTESERGRAPASLAACFAAKEAVAKALGGPAGLRWADVEVVHDRGGRPELALRGTVADAAGRLGVRRWHVSLTHDAGVSMAFVVAEA